MREMRNKDANGNPLPFSLEFVTCDVNRNTGGDIKRYAKAYLSGAEVDRIDQAEKIVKKRSGRQSHFKNATRNIKTTDGELHKVHIFLMTKFNGKTVI